jgi:cell division protein FtsL
MMNSKLLMGLRPGGRPGSPVVPVVLCAAILTLGALFFLWQRYQFVRLGFTVAELRQQKAVLEDVIEPLQIEVEYLSRPQRIEALARERLRMRQPRPGQVRTLSAYDADKF